ncbi:sodium channel protein Nach-like [Topomyia yanbarensis]|uniref:sodium channel protein Nach-like n=1 Tax=Topomyia yanbarensis TaxID=2498891 RepID=UPI00273C4208|nr:sodium channel protein Nach-like [Topomyia yanbarensis]
MGRVASMPTPNIWLRRLKRFYWIIINGGLLYMTISSSYILLLSYLNNPLTFSIDTSYLHWNTTFPAVSLCQVLNDETMADILEQEIGSDRNYKLDNVMSDIAFYGGTCFSCEDCTEGRLRCPTHFSSIVEKYRFGCSELISDCFWQNDPFDCCQLFLPLQTEFGECYSINSQNSRQANKEKLVNNRKTGPGVLRFKVKEDLQIYLHDEHAVPFAYTDGTLKETVLWGTNKEIIFKIIGMENNANVQDIPISRRDCRFPWEILNESTQLYDSYSYSSCGVECFMAAQIKFCNCTHHLMPVLKHDQLPINICSYHGLTCLTENSVKIAKQRKQCQCSSSCLEPEYLVIHSSESEVGSQQDQVSIRMLNLPEIKFVRNVAKTNIDIFISLGGLVGLFFGASLLSIIYVVTCIIRYCEIIRFQ